jgi:hypothetical protein
MVSAETVMPRLACRVAASDKAWGEAVTTARDRVLIVAVVAVRVMRFEVHPALVILVARVKLRRFTPPPNARDTVSQARASDAPLWVPCSKQ